MQKVTVTTTCDVEHARETTGTETHTFTFDGTDYEIDVCDKHDTEMRDTFGAFAKYGRPATRPAPRRARPARNRGFTAGVRNWYAGLPPEVRDELGLSAEINDRGRIPVKIIDAYRAA